MEQAIIALAVVGGITIIAGSVFVAYLLGKVDGLVKAQIIMKGVYDRSKE